MAPIVLVTGASSGIGRSIALLLHQHNFKVYGTSRKPDKYADLPYAMLGLDVKKPSTMDAVISQILVQEGRIDILINNAGVGITGPLEETPIIESKKAFETNFFGPMELINKVLPTMRQQKSGYIINITSIAAHMGLPFRAVYSATKGALELITEAYRIELAPFNIKVCAIAPGDFSTNIAASRFHAPVLEDSDYAKTYEQTLSLIDSHVNDAPSPEPIAQKVLAIINTTDPKPHYTVGSWLQRFSIVLKKLLPQKRYEKILRNHYKL